LQKFFPVDKMKIGKGLLGLKVRECWVNLKWEVGYPACIGSVEDKDW